MAREGAYKPTLLFATTNQLLQACLSEAKTVCVRVCMYVFVGVKTRVHYIQKHDEPGTPPPPPPPLRRGAVLPPSRKTLFPCYPL